MVMGKENNRIKFVISVTVVLAFVEAIIFINNGCYQDIWNGYKEKITRKREYRIMHAHETEVANLPSVSAPSYNYRIIRHSGGVFLVRYFPTL